MRAAVITQPGGPEVLQIQEMPDPTFGPDEVLVAVHASALNRLDLLQRLAGHRRHHLLVAHRAQRKYPSSAALRSTEQVRAWAYCT